MSRFVCTGHPRIRLFTLSKASEKSSRTFWHYMFVYKVFFVLKHGSHEYLLLVDTCLKRSTNNSRINHINKKTLSISTDSSINWLRQHCWILSSTYALRFAMRLMYWMSRIPFCRQVAPHMHTFGTLPFSQYFHRVCDATWCRNGISKHYLRMKNNLLVLLICMLGNE